MLETRILDDDHLNYLVSMSRAFVAESAWGWTWSLDDAYRRFSQFIDSPQADIIGVFERDKLQGAAMVMVSQDFTIEKIAYIAKLYVYPVARKTHAGRTLVESIVNWAREQEAVAIFATATAGIGEDKAFQNMLGKYGFEHAGPTMVRDMGGQ